MNRLPFVCILAGQMFLGCGKKAAEPARPPAAPGQGSVSVENLLGQSPGNPAPASPSPEAPAPVPNAPPEAAAGALVDIAALNHAVQKFWKEKKYPPYTLDELVKSGYVKSIGTPPPGKAIFYNNEMVTVKLVDQ